MENDEMNDVFEQGLSNIQNVFNQLQVQYKAVKNENELLWNLIMEYGGEPLLQELFKALPDIDKSNTAKSMIRKHHELLIQGKYKQIIPRLNALLSVNSQGNSELKESINSLLDDMFSVTLSDLDEQDRFIMDIINWFKRASKSSLRDCLLEYLIHHDDELSHMAVETNSPEVITNYVLLLSTYDLKDRQRKLMEYLMDIEWPFLDSKVNDENFARLLWVAFYHSIDDYLLENAKESSSFLEQSQLPEIQLYKLFHDSMHSLDNQNSSNLISLMYESKLFEDDEKAKLWGKIIKQLENKVSTREMPSKQVEQKQEELEQPKLQRAGRIWQIKNKTDHCPHCKTKLKMDRFLVEGSRKNDSAPKQVPFGLFICDKCQRFYAYDSMHKELNLTLDPHRIKVDLDPIDYLAKKDKSQTVIRFLTNNKTPVPFAWPSTNAHESQGQSDREGTFREETDLHRLGYKITGLSRAQRWDILVRRVIPKMPLKEIAYTIAQHVRTRKSQKSGNTKFAYAIAEWEHDLKRLKNEYYNKKPNFTWPNY